MPDALAREMINREKKDLTKLKDMFNRKGLDKLKVKFISNIIATCDDADQNQTSEQRLFGQLNRI